MSLRSLDLPWRAIVYLLALALSLLTFAAPFLAAAGPDRAGALVTSPLLLTLLIALSGAALLVELQGEALNARTVALLGILVATNAALRFLEVSFPGPGGFSPIFALVILSGFTFGPRFGFLMGVFTLLASALITAGIGPWLPYQMLTTGWMGMSAGLLGRWLRAVLPSGSRGQPRRVVILALFGFVWGMLYGLITNLWFWPAAVGPAGQRWQPGMGLLTTLEHYALFYLTTSAWWDLFRGLGNALLIGLVGAPTLRALERFRRRGGVQGGGDEATRQRGREKAMRDEAPKGGRGARQRGDEAPRGWGEAEQVRRPLHPLVWVVWLGSALVVVSTTRNPLYLVELLLVALVVSFGIEGDAPAPWRPGLRFGLFLVGFSTLFNGLSSHFGRTVLLSLPSGLPLVGGPVTLEALVYGAINGLVLLTMLFLFAVFNQALPAHRMVRLVPRAFHEAGVVLSVAMTYVPATRRSLQQIREAQAVRGHQVRSWRDWLPLWMPLLVSGLERAFQLAEAMVARGFGATADRALPLGVRAGLAGGLLALLTGEIVAAFYPSLRGAAPLLLAVGAALLGLSLWRAGRRVPYTPYRSSGWGWREGVTLAGALLTLAVVVWPGLGIACAGEQGGLLLVGCRGARLYNPYPRFAPPPFDPLAGLALLGLLVPTLASPRSPRAGAVESAEGTEPIGGP